METQKHRRLRYERTNSAALTGEPREGDSDFAADEWWGRLTAIYPGGEAPDATPVDS